uniref:Uncharacterized mitochondrial protein AtMg00810-like n=1 Tax=Tanacetum cinerariifolium TaxID=118510 RepID=A0A6L2M5K7_TANCI|nr:uncharacterized mitochondrial protein AtMg00810-like [Tanacetum cinerariifolium]
MEGVTIVMPITSVEEKAQRRQEVKGVSTLIIGISNEHQLKFNSIKDAKQLLEAVEKRFGGNTATKKTQMNFSKQQYENFSALSSEMLDQTFDRLQNFVSQLELLREKLSQKYINQKLLRSLSLEWNTHAIVWRNKPDLDTMSMDDLYNNLNVQPNSPQLVHEDLEQIHPEDLKEMDLRWQMAMLTIRAKRILKNTGRKLTVNAIRELRRKLEVAQTEKDGIQLKVDKFENASKNLNKLLDCQIIDNCNKGLGCKSYNAVPPPYTRNFVPLTPDLSFIDLYEFVNKPEVKNSEAKPSDQKPKKVKKNNHALIIEDWVSNDEEKDNDCHYHQKQLKNQRMVKPIWNNTHSMNHQNFVKKSHLYPKKNMVPREVLMKSGLKIVNTAYPKTTVNAAKQMSYLSKSAHSTVKRPINKKTTFRNSNVNKIVNIVKGKTVNTARPKAVVNVVQGYNSYAVKALACWVGKPKTKVIDHASKHNSASITLKKFDYIDAQGRSKSVMAWETCLILEITKEIDGGYVAFGGNPKERRITGKDDLDKFDGNADEGFFVQYSLNSKAFIVFNSRKKIMEENLHISDGKKVNEDPSKVSKCKDQKKEENVNDTNNVNTVSSNKVNVVGENISNELPFDPNMPDLKDISTFNFLNNHEDDDAMADMSNLDITIQVSPTPTTRIHKDHHLNQVIRDLHSAAQTRQMLKYLEEHRKELCNAFKEMMHKKFEMSSIGELIFFLGLQVKQKKDGIFISQDKYVAKILKIFGFTEVKNASTPMETQKPLLKDEDGEEVDVHIYRLMIGSLMYLTSSRPDIMFAVCACARYQVNPKVSHLHAMKRIFRYLKGHPNLALWYPKDSPFYLVAYTDSDYARASLDRKSTIRGYQIHGCRLISWQCKKQIVVANFTTKAEYMAASSYYGQNKLRKVLDWNGIGVNTAGSKLMPPSITYYFYKELDNSLVRADNTASSLEVEQDSGNIDKTQSKEIANESSSQVTDSSGGPMFQNAMEDTIDQNREESSNIEASLCEDASKQGRISNIDADEGITLVNTHDDAEMFDADKDLGDEVSLAQALAELKHTKPKAKAKGIVFHELEESTTTTASTIPKPKSQDKGKAIMIEEPVKPKKKDQIKLDEEAALRLQAKQQAKFDEEQKLTRERTQQELEANIALIETYDDVQAKINVDYQLAERLKAEEQ